MLGYTVSYDSAHREGQLAHAGAWYALDPQIRFKLQHFDDYVTLVGSPNVQALGIWPKGWVFRGNTSRIRELQKAGALIAAEIDRLLVLDRLAHPPVQGAELDEWLCEVCSADAASGGQCERCGVHYCADHLSAADHDCEEAKG